MTARLIIISALTAVLLVPTIARAQTDTGDMNVDAGTMDQLGMPAEAPAEQYARAEVIVILEEGEKELGGVPQPYQLVRVKLLSGPEVGREVEIEHGGTVTLRPDQIMEVGDRVVVLASQFSDETNYYIADRYRPWWRR